MTPFISKCFAPPRLPRLIIVDNPMLISLHSVFFRHIRFIHRRCHCHLQQQHIIHSNSYYLHVPAPFIDHRLLTLTIYTRFGLHRDFVHFQWLCLQRIIIEISSVSIATKSSSFIAFATVQHLQQYHCCRSVVPGWNPITYTFNTTSSSTGTPEDQ